MGTGPILLTVIQPMVFCTKVLLGSLNSVAVNPILDYEHLISKFAYFPSLYMSAHHPNNNAAMEQLRQGMLVAF